jgi:sugar phosphate permease
MRDLRITEPATMLTDYALAALAIVLGLLLLKPDSRPIMLWTVGFFLTAAAALTGGTYHGFVGWLNEGRRVALWNVTVFLIGAASGFMIAAAAVSPIGWSDPATKWLLAGLAATLVGLVVQQSNFQLHRHFNHNDISHVIQMGALSFFYLGARLIG